MKKHSFIYIVLLMLSVVGIGYMEELPLKVLFCILSILMLLLAIITWNVNIEKGQPPVKDWGDDDFHPNENL